MVITFRIAKQAAFESVKSVSPVEVEPLYQGHDGTCFDTLSGRFCQVVSAPSVCMDVAGSLGGPAKVTTRQYTRSMNKRLNLKATSQHQAALNWVETASEMSWHVPGLTNVVIKDLEAIQIAPSVAVWYMDWTPHYEMNSYFAPHWDTLRLHKYVEVKSQSYVLQNAKVRTGGRICIPFDCVKQVIKACHEYAHPGVDKTWQMFNRSCICFGYKTAHIKSMITYVVGPCPVCGQNKGRKGLQPESNHPAPVPDYPFWSICLGNC